MKIRNPKVIRGVAWLGSHLIRTWMGTIRLRGHAFGPDIDPRSPNCRGRYVYAFWHETLLLPGFQFRGAKAHVLISQHADGEMIAQVCGHLGIGVLRGSTTRGGAEGLLGMIRSADFSHLAITPDGPRGPRRRVQQGVIYLAALTGLPVAPIGFAFKRCWRAKSWDRFAVPRPFSTGYAVTGHPITVPLRAIRSATGVETYRLRVEDAMNGLTAVAERWAETGRVDPSLYSPALPRALAG